MVTVMVLRAKNGSVGWAAAAVATSTLATASIRRNHTRGCNARDNARRRHVPARRSAIAHPFADVARRTEKVQQRIRGGVRLFERGGVAGAGDQGQVLGAGQARHI